jgi:hypothetical protein
MADLTFYAKLLRRRFRRSATLLRFRRFTLQGVPILFANSFPKSGTHLLTQVLQGFSKIGPAVDSGLPAIVTYQGFLGFERTPQAILSDLHRLLPGDIAYGHLHARPENIACLSQASFATYFILRDPRDVAVSHVFYVTEKEPQHIHHRYYTETLHTFNERLSTSILGVPDPAIPFPDIARRFEPYLAWLDCAAVLTLHYEDMLKDPHLFIGCVLDHALKKGFPCSFERETAISMLEDSINPQHSPTFRSGKSGEWRKYFSDQHKRLFKDVAGDILIRLGYEENHDW